MVWCEFIICHTSQWRLCSCSSVTVTLASAALNIIEIRTLEFTGKHNAGDCISQSNSEHHLYFFSPSFSCRSVGSLVSGLKVIIFPTRERSAGFIFYKDIFLTALYLKQTFIGMYYCTKAHSLGFCCFNKI